MRLNCKLNFIHLFTFLFISSSCKQNLENNKSTIDTLNSNISNDEFVNNDEVRMGDINEDNDDGDPFGDERDPDNDDDYN